MYFRERLTVKRGGRWDRGPVADTGNEAVIAEILIEDSRGVFVYGFGVLPGGFIDNLCQDLARIILVLATRCPHCAF